MNLKDLKIVCELRSIKNYWKLLYGLKVCIKFKQNQTSKECGALFNEYYNKIVLLLLLLSNDFSFRNRLLGLICLPPVDKTIVLTSISFPFFHLQSLNLSINIYSVMLFGQVQCYEMCYSCSDQEREKEKTKTYLDNICH